MNCRVCGNPCPPSKRSKVVQQCGSERRFCSDECGREANRRKKKAQKKFKFTNLAFGEMER